MRCEDCLSLIEEYFDGEVTGQTGELLGAHLSACADCAAALDALSFEQEMYARYDRGVEVTPQLWARVSAEIAREPLPQSPAERRPFLNRAGALLTAALGALTARPALASSLALLVFGVTAGSLWLARRPHKQPASVEVAHNAPSPSGGVDMPPAPNGGTGNVTPSTGSSSTPAVINGDETYDPSREGVRESASVQRTVKEPRRAAEDTDGARLIADATAPQASTSFVVFRPEEHAVAADDSAALILNASAPARDLVGGDAQPLEPVEKEVARHVERAQMFLRSIKNTRASEVGAADIAYEKKLSRKLLAENATLKLEAEVKGDKDTRQVLDQIEPFLLDIANMGEQPSREEVRSIRERVRKNEIVAALQVY